MADHKKVILDENTLRYMTTEVIHKIMQGFVYHANNPETRATITHIIDGLFTTFKETRIIYDYKVFCDETNNTSKIIDNGELRVAVAYKKDKDSQFMLVDFISTRTDASFTELNDGEPRTYNYYDKYFEVAK